ELLPSLRITAGIGTTSTESFRELLDLENLVWNIGQGLSAPVFDRRQIKAGIRAQEHNRDQLIYRYAQTVLEAFRDVEIALTAEKYFDQQIAVLTEAAKEAKTAESLSLGDYEAGVVDIITLLQSQRRAFDAQSTLLNVRLAKLRNRVDLYLGLGGDFDHEVQSLK
ncbi:MAG: TolC family protein, partial [Verrucomicrobiota bacterium]